VYILGYFSGYGKEISVKEAREIYGNPDKPRIIPNISLNEREDEKVTHHYSNILHSIMSSAVVDKILEPYFSMYFTRNSSQRGTLYPPGFFLYNNNKLKLYRIRFTYAMEKTKKKYGFDC
jgi:hypothetical protein